MAIINPYSGINLQTVSRIQSVSHQHLSHTKSLTQGYFNDIYATGVRHFAISRYRPSIITYPFDYDNNTFEYVANAFSSTDSLETIKANDTVTIEMEDDVIGSPNAEHLYSYIAHKGKWNRWSNIHINAIGSTYESGTIPDPNDGYSDCGTLIPYTDAIDNMLANLQFNDGGGIIINHPCWTNDNKHFDYSIERFVSDCLDYNSNVLGTDIIEGGGQTRIPYDTQLIDNILSTGRRCWIFCQGDWYKFKGRNEMLIPSGLSRSEAEHEILKAYRNGAFFGRLANSNLSITSISFSNNVFSITAANADGIDIITDGEKTSYEGTSAEQTISSSAKYVRAVAYINKDDDPDWEYKDPENDIYKDIVFTNPIMINPVEYDYDPAYDIIPGTNSKGFSMLFWG